MPARGGLDDDAALLQQALGFGVVDHGLGDTVFHAAGGVEVFQFGQNFGLQAVLLLYMGQFQQGGLADQLVSGSINVAHGIVSFSYCRIRIVMLWVCCVTHDCRSNIGNPYETGKR